MFVKRRTEKSIPAVESTSMILLDKTLFMWGLKNSPKKDLQSEEKPPRLILMSQSWSYSAFSTALQCLRKYQLCYVDKIIPVGPDSSDLIFGSALHCAINAQLTGEDGLATFELYWSTYQEKDVEYGRFNWQQLASIGANFLRKFVKLHASRYNFKFGETRLYGEYRGLKLEGTLDFYGDYDGRPALRDFKTSGRNYDAAKQDCASQLYLYAYLAHTNGIGKIETLGYTVFNKAVGSIQDLTWAFDESTMYKALDDMVGYCELFGHTTFVHGADKAYPRNLNSCLDYNRKCPYFDTCHTKETK